MNVNVKKLTKEESVLEVSTKNGVKELIIKKTKHGHSYNDFGEWDITDEQYYELEELVDIVMSRMEGGSQLNVTWG